MTKKPGFEKPGFIVCKIVSYFNVAFVVRWFLMR